MENLIFKKVSHHDTGLMEQIYRLRLKVYGRQCGFINEEDYPCGLETDEYDPHAVHFAAINSAGHVVGSLRMIPPGQYLLPVERHCDDLIINKSSMQDLNFAEISRLVVCKELMRKNFFASLSIQSQRAFKQLDESEAAHIVEQRKPLVFGLCREVFKESLVMGITHWYALMENGLWQLLKMHGFNFKCIGNEVDVFGPVKPYVSSLSDLETAIKNFQLRSSWAFSSTQTHRSLITSAPLHLASEPLMCA